jgi:predicted DNA-binding protein (UPF0278 family)
MIIKFVFDVLIGVPLTLSKQILEKIRDEVDKERLVTEESIKNRLQELQLLLQNDEISEDEYEQLEARLIDRLKVVREYRRSQVR